MFSATMRLDDSVVAKTRREEFVDSILTVSGLTCSTNVAPLGEMGTYTMICVVSPLSFR